MDKEMKPDGLQPASLTKMKGKKRPGRGFTEFAEKHIPEGAVIDFIFLDDFDGDCEKEAVIGYTQFSPFPPESSVIFLKRAENGFTGNKLISEDDQVGYSNYGIYDCASAADTDGDGLPELIVTLAAGNGHYTTLFVFDWKDGVPGLAWHSEDSFYHGSVEICDTDGDKVFEMAVESGTLKGSEILELNEACYHVRESCIYKWDGKCYNKYPFQVRMPYLSYNTAVEFLTGLWKQEYRRIYDLAVLPGFMGLEGLDDSNPAAFKRFIEKYVRPVLARNLSMGKLEPAEPYDAYCLFSGAEDDITVEIVKDKGMIKVQCISIYKKSLIVQA